jgi:hypothetical protein
LLIFILLVVSGNPEGRQSKYLVFIFAIFITFIWYKNINYAFLKKMLFVIITLMLFFLMQAHLLGYTSWLGNINLFFKIFLAGLVFWGNGKNIIFRFYNTIFYISFLSLILMSLDLIGIMKFLPYTYTEDDRYYYFFYQTRPDFMRNSGMFWEPGVFSNFLILAITLILPYYKIINKFKLLVILIALISTFSTSGYILLFFILLYKIFKVNITSIFVSSIFVLFFLFLYTSTPFLGEKINEQSDIALSADGEMNYTRLGQMLFDLHYIEKHPFLGNGMHIKTRYADHPMFQDENYEVGHGNGFSQFVVSFGIVFVFFYFVIIARNVNMLYQKDFRFTAFFILIIVLSLQNEPMMTYSFYWGFLFLGKS